MRRGRPTGTTGVLRVDSRAARLAPRLQPGDIAVLDHIDLDAPMAQVLVSRGVAAVINAAPGSSGRYPNLGPTVLVDAGVPVLSDVGAQVMSVLREGHEAKLEGDALWVDGAVVARGTRLDPGTVAETAALSRGGVAAQLADLVANAAGYLVDERALVLEGTGVPELKTRLSGRTVVVVGPSYGAREDVRRLKRLRRRHKPVVIAVDGGADLLRELGAPADVVVGDPETMSDAALQLAGELVLRAETAGLDRVHDLAVPFTPFATRAAAEDMALLMALHGGASVVVTAGLPRTLEELLDRGREAAASSLTTRFALGANLVPAHVAGVLTPRRSWGLPVLCLLLAGALAVAVGVGHEVLLQRWHELGR